MRPFSMVVVASSSMMVVVPSVSQRVFLPSREPGLGNRMNNRLQRDLVRLQVFIVLKRVVRVRNVVVRGSLVLSVARVIFCLTLEVLVHASKVLLAEDAVMGHEVVPSSGLVVVRVREASRLGHGKVQREESVSIVNGVHLLTVQVFEHIVLDDRVLCLSSGVGPGQLTTDAVAKGKNVFITLVLQSVFVDIDETVGISKA